MTTPSDLFATSRKLLHKKPIVAGIYLIYCYENKKGYIGSSNNIYRRLYAHHACLTGNRHFCPPLQAAWNLYGKAAFALHMIKRCPTESTNQELLAWENEYLLNCDKEQLFNTTIPAVLGREAGFEHTEETKQIISERHKQLHAEGKDWWIRDRIGIPLSEEHKAKLSASKKGQVAWNKGGTHTEEVCAKMSVDRQGSGNSNASLTWEKVREIRSLLAHGYTQTRLAKMFGVGQGAISRIKLNKAWVE